MTYFTVVDYGRRLFEVIRLFFAKDGFAGTVNRKVVIRWWLNLLLFAASPSILWIKAFERLTPLELRNHIVGVHFCRQSSCGSRLIPTGSRNRGAYQLGQQLHLRTISDNRNVTCWNETLPRSKSWKETDYNTCQVSYFLRETDL